MSERVSERALSELWKVARGKVDDEARVSEWVLRELWKVVRGGVEDEAGTRRWAKLLRPGQINQEDPSDVSEC
jgi:hypothetical protein